MNPSKEEPPGIYIGGKAMKLVKVAGLVDYIGGNPAEMEKVAGLVDYMGKSSIASPCQRHI
ncbi:hypothetical protein [Paenibacillus taihuensis]|uniref:hypothetical protein n=1 Tax=Paenibacillus taihuensis TaxID=1156355 RepID=UPI0011C0604F|nr:hypothetical protein [Paenibacillus taihuensis]